MSSNCLQKLNDFYFCRPEFDARGGRRSGDLPHLATHAKNFTHVFVIVGDNDVKELHVADIYDNYRKFANLVYPTKVRFCGHFKRKELSAKQIELNNLFLYRKLGYRYKSPRTVKNKDFGNRTRYHFSPYRHGFHHMGALILSALNDFDKYW